MPHYCTRCKRYENDHRPFVVEGICWPCAIKREDEDNKLRRRHKADQEGKQK